MKMHNLFKKFYRRGPQAENQREINIIEELREVRRQLDGIQSYFAIESDNDLIDAAIYLRESLEARHRYLLKLAREQNLTALAVPVATENRERLIT